MDQAYGNLYYEHFGQIGPPYHIHWYDEPDHWEEEGNKAICIDVTKCSQLLYKITLVVTTGLIQAQGSCQDKFARRHFPKLLELVKNICAFNNVCNDRSGNPSTRTDTQQTVQNVDDGSGNASTSTGTQQTVQNVDNNDTNVKEVFDSKRTLTTPQINTEGKDKHNEDSETDLKQGSHDIDQHDPHYKTNSKCTIAFKGTNKTPDDTMPKPTAAYEDINIIQSRFVEALKSITNTQTLFIKRAEKSLQNALGNTICTLVDTINELRMDLKSNLAIHSDSSNKIILGVVLRSTVNLMNFKTSLKSVLKVLRTNYDVYKMKNTRWLCQVQNWNQN